MSADIPRLTDAELDAVLAKHVVCHGPNCGHHPAHCKAHREEVIPWPCETVRLAKMAKDLLAVEGGIMSHWGTCVCVGGEGCERWEYLVFGLCEPCRRRRADDEPCRHKRTRK